jgi:hypothetical protein
MVFIGFLWGLAVKYVPALKGIPNALIPYMNALVALFAGLTGPATAHAFLGGAISGQGFFGHILGAGWAAIQSALIYEVFGRHPANALGIKKA